MHDAQKLLVGEQITRFCLKIGIGSPASGGFPLVSQQPTPPKIHTQKGSRKRYPRYPKKVPQKGTPKTYPKKVPQKGTPKRYLTPKIAQR